MFVEEAAERGDVLVVDDEGFGLADVAATAAAAAGSTIVAVTAIAAVAAVAAISSVAAIAAIAAVRTVTSVKGHGQAPVRRLEGEVVGVEVTLPIGADGHAGGEALGGSIVAVAEELDGVGDELGAVPLLAVLGLP